MRSTIVIIKSGWKNKARRDAQRATWLPYLRLPHKFVVGKRKVKAYGENPMANPENEPNMLILPVSDARMDLSPKIKGACEWALENGYTQMVVLDDDTFVDTARLADYCERAFALGKDYVGFQGPNREWMSGSAYIISISAMRILSVAPELKDNTHDDIQTGLALKGRVIWEHTEKFNVGPVPEPLPLPDNEIITAHKCLPDVMREVSTRHTMAFGK